MISRSKRQPPERDVPAASDAELMRELAAGQLGALGELYDRYQAPLRGFITRATSDAHDVDDLVHTTFLETAKCAHRYDGRTSCRPWLIGIAAQLLRRRRTRSVASSPCSPLSRGRCNATAIRALRSKRVPTWNAPSPVSAKPSASRS